MIHATANCNQPRVQHTDYPRDACERPDIWRPLPLKLVPEGLVVTSLQIEPSEIKLESPFSYAQIIVTGRLDSGEMLDLTRQASFQIDAKVATTSSIGLVRPLSDGETTLKISWGEFEADIPVSVQGQSQSFEPSFARCSTYPVELGCNAGTCHGSKDGKGGFKLSLRGYDSIFDFSADR